MSTTITRKEELTDQLETANRPPTDFGKNPWTTGAPKRVARHCRPGVDGKGWETWSAHLAQRNKPLGLNDLLSGRRSPLLWCVPAEIVPPNVQHELAQLAGDGRRRIDEIAAALDAWLTDGTTDRPSATAALTALGVAHALPAAASWVEPGLWWSLLERLVGNAQDAGTLTVDPEQPPADVWAAQLLAGELPLSLAYLFPELRPCQKLLKPARASLSAGLNELCDGEGVLPLRLVDVHRPLAACWTRCQAMAKAMKVKVLSDGALAELEWHIRQIIRFSRSDGGPLLGGPALETWSPDLFTALLRLAGDASDAAAAAKSLPGNVAPPKLLDERARTPEPSSHSDWAGMTVMRPDWRRRAPRFAIGYDGTRVQLELENARSTILRGEWHVDICVDGKQRPLENEWEEICWHSDKDVDYLELSIDLVGGGQIERQIVLAREDQILVLVDNVIAEKGTRVEYTGRLPLADGTNWSPEAETRDGLLSADKPLAAVMPLALPEWQIEDRIGQLTPSEGSLVLRQETDVGNLCCPIFFDLKPRRLVRERTWRQLTIAESLVIQPTDVAVGYRIQSGKDQWLYYRSLAEYGNRTLLGQNFSSDFYLGRFHTDGTIHELIEIEAEEEA